jgi:transmembrane sensor
MTVDRDQDRIDSEASAWLVALEDDHGLERRGEFEAWRMADRRNAATFADMRQTWSDISKLRALAHLAPADTPASVNPMRSGARRRISIIALAAAAVVAFLVVPVDYRQRPQSYATTIAETRSVRLPDGSTAMLGARSALSISFAGNERRVVLTGGEAFFDVVHDAGRPFTVVAGEALIRDIGTKFNVNLAEGSVRVAVAEGAVEVARCGHAAERLPPTLLEAGERTELLASNGSPVRPVVLPSTAPAAWQEGRLVYDNVRLADLVADVNRYYPPGVRLASPSVGAMRVTASFRTNEIPALLNALSATLPVKVDQVGNGAYSVGPRS